jgi:hypothetical protein
LLVGKLAAEVAWQAVVALAGTASVMGAFGKGCLQAEADGVLAGKPSLS